MSHLRLKKNREQVAMLQSRMEKVVEAVPEMAKLYDILLSIDGFAVTAQDEPDLEKLISRGILEEGQKAKMIRGKSRQCHGNAAVLWADDPEETKIVTGWALSDDGIWRQHSWAKRGGRIFETTERRLLYFGVELSPVEAISFSAANLC